MNKTHGGKRSNSGRKKKPLKDHVNTIISSALSEIHNTETDIETKKEFIKELHTSQRGQLFLAEHLFGKPTARVETLNQNFEVHSIKPIEWV